VFFFFVVFFFRGEGVLDLVVDLTRRNMRMGRGVNGETGKIVDMKSYGLYESASVKVRLQVAEKMSLFSFLPL
jgi:hypothetical protein